MVHYYKDKTLPNRFKECRIESGITQPNLAKMLGFKATKQLIYAYENGKRLPTVNTLIKMHEIFGVSTDYLLALDDYKNHNDYLCNALGIDEILLDYLNSTQSEYEMKRINTFIHRHYKGDSDEA